jgi:hypothetical protein
VSRALRLAGVLVTSAGIVAAGTTLRVPTLDLSAAGSAGGPAGGALAARTTLVQRAELVCPGPETIGVRGVEPVGRAPAPAAVLAATPPAAAATAGQRDGADGADAESGGGQGSTERGATDTLRASAVPGAGLSTKPTGPASGPTSTTSTEPAGVRLTGTGGRAPGLVAGQTTLVPSGDLRGLSSAACTEPSDDAWLVAGGTDIGRRGRLVLVNAADNPVDVDVEVLGERGAVPRSAGSSVQVPARSRTVLLLDALAPGVRSPVVHVTTTAGALAATLSDAWLSGTSPRGVDDAVPAAAPAREALVPALLGGGPSSVRIASTGAAEAVAQVRLIGPSGPVELPDGGVVRVPGQSSRALDLGNLRAGGYLVQVRSDEPVVAGALVQRSGPIGELAWFGSTAPAGALVGGAGLRGGDGWSSTLVLAAPRDRVRGELVTVRDDGSSRTVPVDVAAGTVTTVDTGDAVAAWLRPATGTGTLVAARATTRDDPAGQLLTGGALVPAPVEQQLPAVVPAR